VAKRGEVVLHHTIPLILASTYPIYIGEDIFCDLGLLTPHLIGKQILIVSQENIAQHYLAKLQANLANFQCNSVLLPTGERYKTLAEWQTVLDVLLQHKHERSTTLIALGGGIVGDITGFAAACYLRGVNYIQIATTLIAQVDSAIGGKTAVNHPLAKNMIGAFHQPVCVIADIALLRTLPQREYIAGLAEVVKYALIYAVDFFNWLENNIDKLLVRDTGALLHAVHTSVAIKTNIVMQDECDQDLRNILNFGHTFGHALEAANHYENLLHGEAILIGMQMAIHLSVTVTGLAPASATRILKLLQKITFPLLPFELPEPMHFLQWLQHDKKILAGKNHFILLEAIGHAIKTAAVSDTQIISAIKKGGQNVLPFLVAKT
jgi:3-dehydroquinate synthase